MVERVQQKVKFVSAVNSLLDVFCNLRQLFFLELLVGLVG